MVFIDTNYILRFLLKDIENQYQEALLLFEKGAMGEVELFTSMIVFFELEWVLSSFYKMSKKEVLPMLDKFLNMNFITIEGKDLLLDALETFGKSSFDLEDSFNLVYAKSHTASSFATFDQKLRKEFNLRQKLKN